MDLPDATLADVKRARFTCSCGALGPWRATHELGRVSWDARLHRLRHRPALRRLSALVLYLRLRWTLRH